MGGFLGIGGSSAKTDRKLELQGFGDLSNVFNFAMPVAKAGVGGALNYFSKLAGGNRAAVMQAEAPEINAVKAGSDAVKRQAETMGTARTGGTTAQNRQIDTDTSAKIDNLLFGVRPRAALAEGQIGENALRESGATAANITDIAAGSRKTSFAINQAQQQQVGQVLDAVFGAIAA